jgi:predicted membrane channel-forming protein YqfA (hemolysin III family)
MERSMSVALASGIAVIWVIAVIGSIFAVSWIATNRNVNSIDLYLLMTVTVVVGPLAIPLVFLVKKGASNRNHPAQ